SKLSDNKEILKNKIAELKAQNEG
ncbi:TPA: hypothetical protein ACICD8_001834, partial [Campylobacter jejuni]